MNSITFHLLGKFTKINRKTHDINLNHVWLKSFSIILLKVFCRKRINIVMNFDGKFFQHIFNLSLLSSCSWKIRKWIFVRCQNPYFFLPVTITLVFRSLWIWGHRHRQGPLRSFLQCSYTFLLPESAYMHMAINKLCFNWNAPIHL